MADNPNVKSYLANALMANQSPVTPPLPAYPWSPTQQGAAPPPQQLAETTKIPWSGLSAQEQAIILQNAVPLVRGTPAANKYDEALQEHGSVILPDKNFFGPDEWQDKLFPPGVIRHDLPDGRVILRMPPSSPPLTS